MLGSDRRGRGGNERLRAPARVGMGWGERGGAGDGADNNGTRRRHRVPSFIVRPSRTTRPLRKLVTEFCRVTGWSMLPSIVAMTSLCCFLTRKPHLLPEDVQLLYYLRQSDARMCKKRHGARGPAQRSALHQTITTTDEESGTRKYSDTSTLWLVVSPRRTLNECNAYGKRMRPEWLCQHESCPQRFDQPGRKDDWVTAVCNQVFYPGLSAARGACRTKISDGYR